MLQKKLLSFLIGVIINFSYIGNVYSIEPDVFIQSTVNRAAKTLGGNLTKDERVEKLKDIARETVDIRGIGLYSLGAHRKSLNEESKKKYEEVFEQYFLKSFASRLAEYSNPEIEVNSKEKINDNYTIVSSTLVATDSRPEVKIDWRVYTKNPDKYYTKSFFFDICSNFTYFCDLFWLQRFHSLFCSGGDGRHFYWW